MLKKIPTGGGAAVALSSGEVDDLRTSLGLTAVDPHVSYVDVLSSDSAVTIKSKIETINAETGPGDSQDVGRIINLSGKRMVTDFLTISQAQTLMGVKGAGQLALNPLAVGVDPGDGTTGYITVANDFRSSGGIAAQGLWGNIDIDASGSQGMATPTRIHGLYGPLRAGSAAMPTMFNIGVYGAKNDGIHFDDGNDKLVAIRLRQEGSLERGIYIGGSDCKLHDIGTVSQGTAMEIAGAAVEMDTFDIWRSGSPTAAPTLKITGASNGCVLKSGTIEGDTLFIGKNANGANLGINSKAQFAFVHFKLKSGFTGRTSLFKAQSADLIEFISCKWGQTGNGSITPYNYLIEITNTDDPEQDGLVKIIGGSGMLRFLGRAGDTNKMKMDCLKHIINKPWRLLFEWGRMGTVEDVPYWAVDSSDPTIRTHLACDGATYNVADQPFGYLNWAAHHGNWAARLDDGVTTFTMPIIPRSDSYTIPSLRAIP